MSNEYIEIITNAVTGEVTENRRPFTEEELAEQALVLTTRYQRQRSSAYPSIQEQLDMQYWDSVNGTTTWADAIAQVKSDYPKPE
jgi:hypothetical protein